MKHFHNLGAGNRTAVEWIRLLDKMPSLKSSLVNPHHQFISLD
jgi:hypothetical protein